MRRADFKRIPPACESGLKPLRHSYSVWQLGMQLPTAHKALHATFLLYHTNIGKGAMNKFETSSLNLLYERSHSGRILVNKGYRRNGPSFTIFWFIIIKINFAGPFTLNLLGEIYLIIRVGQWTFYFFTSV